MEPETTARLEVLMDAAWPAVEREQAAGWIVRAASGVTQRANSVWPREPGGGLDDQLAALRDARLWYRNRRLPLIFQVFDDSRSAALNALLDDQGFTRQSETLILTLDTAGAGNLRADTTGLEISHAPSEEWLQLWWSIDGRGGPAERGTALAILAGCPALYALVRDDDGAPAAVGRLAIPAVDGGASGGVYCMATRPDVRRRGLGGRVLSALGDAAAAAGTHSLWLLVTARNHGAQALYVAAGFRETGRYIYRQERPRRHLTGC